VKCKLRYRSCDLIVILRKQQQLYTQVLMIDTENATDILAVKYL